MAWSAKVSTLTTIGEYFPGVAPLAPITFALRGMLTAGPNRGPGQPGLWLKPRALFGAGLWRDRLGASVIEYSILVAVITVLVVAAVVVSGTWVQSAWIVARSSRGGIGWDGSAHDC